MDLRPVENMLALLRALQPTPSNTAPLVILKGWFGDDEAAIAKGAAQIIEQSALAVTLVEKMNLAEEAKAGIVQALRNIRTAFSLEALQQGWGGHIRDVTTSISILGMLISFSQANTQPGSLPPEAVDLIADIEDVAKSFTDAEIDPEVRQVALRHLTLLATLLRHMPIFGAEIALTEYFEMMLKIRRADVGASPASSEKTQTVWDRMKGWGEKLGTIDKVWTSGAKLIAHADNAGLLDYIPEL